MNPNAGQELYAMCQPFRFDTLSGTCLWMLCAAASGLSVLSAPACTSAGQARVTADGWPVIDVGSRRQVFIDGRFLLTSANVELVVHPPRKTGEHTLKPEHPWEPHFGTYNSVLKWNDTYHMWYRAGKAMCYARSKDGIHWEKPILGLANYEGSKDNNIVVGHGTGGLDNCGHGGMVFLDPTAPAEEKLRMVLRVNEPAKVVIALASPDGIHWKLTHDKVLSFTEPERGHHLDSQNVIFWDDRIHKYVAYMRRNCPGSGSQGRTVARSESKDLNGFAETQDTPIVIGHDSLDAMHGDVKVVDYYTNATIKYPWAEDVYYMFPQAYYHYVQGYLHEFREEAPINAGPLHTQFAASRDGIQWERFDRRPFVRLGLKGTFDCKSARLFYGLVPALNDQEMYMYYWGGDRTHGWGRNEKNNQLLTQAGVQPTQNVTIINRLVLRRDGFISARAAYSGGEFTTPLLTFEGGELVINVDTSATGIVRCELLDRTGVAVEGYSLDNCDRIHTANEINRVVRWQGESDVSKLAREPIRLRFVYRDADLYAFQFRTRN